MRTWKEWHLDQWDDYAPNETLDNVNLWKRVLEIKDANETWNESDLRQLYLNTTYQTNEVIINPRCIWCARKYSVFGRAFPSACWAQI